MPFSGDPLGTTPLGTPVAAVVGDPPDKSGLLTRSIDPRTKDYAIDADRREFKRWTKTQQRVYLALLTVKGSSAALPGFGVDLPRKLDQSSTERIKASVRLVLRRLVEVERVIRDVRISVDRHPNNAGRVLISVDYATRRGARETVDTEI